MDVGKETQTKKQRKTPPNHQNVAAISRAGAENRFGNQRIPGVVAPAENTDLPSVHLRLGTKIFLFLVCFFFYPFSTSSFNNRCGFPASEALIRRGRCNPSPWDARPSSCARGRGAPPPPHSPGNWLHQMQTRRGETCRVCVCVCVCVLGRFILVYRSGRNAGGLGGGAHRERDGGAAGGMEGWRWRTRRERERRWSTA